MLWVVKRQYGLHMLYSLPCKEEFMAGLINENFQEEVITELSWIKTVISSLCEKEGIETYESLLLKYAIEPEEAEEIERFVVRNLKDIEKYEIIDIQNEIAKSFFENTKKDWMMQDDVLEKLIEAKIKALKL